MQNNLNIVSWILTSKQDFWFISRPLAKVKLPQYRFHEISEIKSFSDSEFQRLVGVPRAVFSEMVEVLKEAESLKKKLGRPHTLAIEDQLLLTLNYLRSYNTQLELAANYHIAESNVNRTIKRLKMH